MADAEGMFYQIQVASEDSGVLQFLWWPNGDMDVNPFVQKKGVTHQDRFKWVYIDVDPNDKNNVQSSTLNNSYKNILESYQQTLIIHIFVQLPGFGFLICFCAG